MLNQVPTPLKLLRHLKIQKPRPPYESIMGLADPGDVFIQRLIARTSLFAQCTAFGIAKEFIMKNQVRIVDLQFMCLLDEDYDPVLAGALGLNFFDLRLYCF